MTTDEIFVFVFAAIALAAIGVGFMAVRVAWRYRAAFLAARDGWAEERRLRASAAVNGASWTWPLREQERSDARDQG